MKTRVARLREEMLAKQLDAILITNGINRKYVSGFTGSSGCLLVTSDRAFLFTDFRYMTQANEQAPHFEVIEHGANMYESVHQALQECKVQAVGFEQHHVTVAEFNHIQSTLNPITCEATSGIIEQLRMLKDEEELKVMQEAAELADRTFSHVLKLIKPGVTEREIALEIEYYMRKNGATSSSFDTIVASGERSALPHGIASDRVLQNGEFVKLDFGAYYKHYCSDMTRTVMLGQPTERHREIYDIVLEAQLTALDGIRPGMTGQQADALAREVIERYGYGQHFGHGTGHGLGLEIHEAPRLSKTSDTILSPGMTVTVEPGIYIPHFGGVRIEDDIVITESGIKILTSSTKDFLILN